MQEFAKGPWSQFFRGRIDGAEFQMVPQIIAIGTREIVTKGRDRHRDHGLGQRYRSRHGKTRVQLSRLQRPGQRRRSRAGALWRKGCEGPRQEKRLITREEQTAWEQDIMLWGTSPGNNAQVCARCGEHGKIVCITGVALCLVWQAEMASECLW